MITAELRSHTMRVVGYADVPGDTQLIRMGNSVYMRNSSTTLVRKSRTRETVPFCAVFVFIPHNQTPRENP